MKKSVAFTLAVILTMAVCLVVICACTPNDSNGVEVFGLYATEEYPVEITRLDYQLNVSDVPWVGWGEDNYYNNFSIDYQFYNPTASDCTMTLYTPEMLSAYCYSGSVIPVAEYSVTVDDEEVESTYRHAMNSAGNGSSNLSQCFGQMRNDRLADDYYNSELIIYKYVYGITLSNATYAKINVNVKTSENVFLDRLTYSTESMFGKMTLSYTAGDDSTLEVYSVGKSLSNYENCVKGKITSREDKNGSVSVNFQYSEVLTFDNLAMAFYDESLGISETDYYNAVVDKMNAQGGILSDKGLKQFSVFSDIVPWRIFEITVPAGKYVDCNVRGPLFPIISRRRATDMFTYVIAGNDYSKFASICDMKVNVTTHYADYNSHDEFAATDTGYFARYGSYSDSRITLCDKDEKSTGGAILGKNFGITLLIFSALLFILAPIIAVTIVLVSDKRSSKKRAAAKQSKQRVITEDTQTTTTVKNDTEESLTVTDNSDSSKE